jgi:hypothetical protein
VTEDQRARFAVLQKWVQDHPLSDDDFEMATFASDDSLDVVVVRMDAETFQWTRSPAYSAQGPWPEMKQGIPDMACFSSGVMLMPGEYKKASSRVQLAPGSTLVSLVALLAKRNALRCIVEQSIADMRIEHYEALAAGDFKLARWVAIRGSISTIWAVVMHIGVWALVGRVTKMFKGE